MQDAEFVAGDAVEQFLVVEHLDEAGTVAFTYDNRGRLKTETDVFGHITERIYDAASRRTQLKLDGNVHTTYNYDNADRLTTLTDETSQNFTFAYDIANRLTSRTMPNGITSTFEYDDMSRLTRLKHQSTSATLFDNQYSYNSANQISQITEQTQTKNFTYDNIDRLTSMTNGSANESYVFDAVGNRTSSHRSAAYGYQPFNRIASTQTAVYGSDANGNMTTKGEGSNFWRYSWDYENRLSEASTRRQKVRYRYDALGRRVSRGLGYGKEQTKFTYDGQDVLVDDNFGTQTKYLNGSGIDNKLRQTTGTTTNYFLADHLGSTNGLANSSGALTASNSYDSFGNPTNTAFSSRYQFTGREFDSFSGLQFTRARFYDPNLGRFISEDPIGFDGGDVNLYGYVGNDPLNFTDPFGKDEYDIAERLLRYQNQQIDNPRPSFRYNYGCPNSGFGFGAFSDFLSNYSDMRQANTVGADKFFHCMANCEAARRGSLGSGISRGLSEGREIFDEHFKGDPPAACNADRFANDTGRSGGAGCGTCTQVCSQFRPSGLTFPVIYPPNPPRNPCQGYGNWSCK